MRFPEVIRRKRNGGRLSPEEVVAFAVGVSQGTLPDEQVGALLMAIFFQGLDREETVALTRAMLDSGTRLAWPSDLSPRIADKHSTGGVGDKVSLPLAPALAACGLIVPMISGRGLGHTGGTLDKLESIPGYTVCLSADRIQAIALEVGCVICGQTAEIAPADRRLYAIRDVTATVESVPLITASILSKKAAAGLAALVLDVKVGKGAFMKTLAEARALAESLVQVGCGLGMRMAARITSMDHPIGRTIGNALEVGESVACLRGEGPPDLGELVGGLGGALLHTAGLVPDAGEGARQIGASLRDGRALERFRRMVEAVGGDPRVVDAPERVLPRAPARTVLPSRGAGVIDQVDAMALAQVALELGAGRSRKEDAVDPAVGLELLVDQGQRVEAGDPWVRVHHREDLATGHEDRLQAALILSQSAPSRPVPGRILETLP